MNTKKKFVHTMATTKNNYELLISKLDRFIRKYYINKLIRGTLYSIGIILALFVLFNVLEYYYYFDKPVRKGFFYSFLGISAVSLAFWVVFPLLQYFKLGAVISHEQAATIVGHHFSNVKDKLLNVLQLKQQSDTVDSGNTLLLASIDQKSEDIKLTPFQKAIDLSKNKKYLRYALPPLMLLLCIFFINADIIKDGTSRIVNNDKEFEREAPFTFSVENPDMEVVQYEDFLLKVKTEGDVIPNEVFVDIDGYQYKLTQATKNTFTYNFKNVQKATDFKLTSGGFYSEEYALDVLSKPDILGFEVKLDYPSYTGRTDEALTDIGDMVVPLGTNLDWLFDTRHTDIIDLKFSGDAKTKEAKRNGAKFFTFKRKAMKDEAYKVYVSNEFLPNADSVGYSISVVPDLNPTIAVEKFEDSLDSKLIFFVGDAADDYGLSKLTFNYRIKNERGAEGALNSIPVKQAEGKRLEYDYTWDIRDLSLNPGDQITYYFEVYDNDGINGAKSARTQLMSYAVPTLEEIEEIEDQNNEEIKEDLKEAIKESKEIKDKMKEMRDKLLQEKELDWQDRKELEKLLDQQKELEKKIEDAKENFEENMKNQEEFNKQNEELMEKQEKVQELFEELMSDEMKDLMKQMEELLEKMNKEEALENLEEMEMNDEELEMELDRMLELFKQLELESEMMDQVEDLEKLAEETEKLSEDTAEEKMSQEELEKKQEEINEKFEELKEKQEELEKKNEELENPQDMDGMEEAMEEIQEELQDSEESLDQKENKKASESQKGASDKMKQAAQKMQQQMQSAEMEQAEEDMESLRQLLENLVTLSFEQEQVMADVSGATINTPRYVSLVQNQYKIKDDFKIVEDSLHALSKRVYQIESFVTEKVTEIKANVNESLEHLEERRKQPAAVNQNTSMKGLNDLALMLSEVLNQMQQQMASQMSGSQMCQKPGGAKGQGKNGKKPSAAGMKGMQEQLNKDMQKMKEGMSKGKGGMSKQYAEMAKRQAAIREAMEKMQREKQQSGEGGDSELQEMIDEMNKTEIDLVNKKLNNETMKRQEDIMSRLLKSEKAERQREYDEKRKAEKATERERKMPPALEEYIKQRESEINMYKTVSPSLKPYYKILVEEYYNSLKGE